jgi:phosphate transport system substrate-binding protein
MPFYALSVSSKKNKMKRKSLIISFFFVIALAFTFLYACNKKKKEEDKQTILEGKQTVLVDETILPVIEDQVAVFESQYNAKIELIGKSEAEIIQLLSKNKQQLAVLTRELSKNEAEIFEINQIKGRITPLATDAIALISNKSNNLTKISVQDIITFMQAKDQSQFNGLVFDNSNSSTVRYFKELAKVKELPETKIFSFQTNNEVIQFVAKNTGMIGVVGVNWLMQPQLDMQSTVDKVNLLAVKSLKTSKFVRPTQENMATGEYPLTREIKMLNYQGFSGLGMGFASFVAGEIGQRIILKSGLMPIRVPSRNIIIRNDIEKKK